MSAAGTTPPLARVATLTVAAVVVVVLTCAGLGGLALLAATGSGCGLPPSARGGWSGEQVANAATIVAVGARMRVPAYGWVVAVATAMAESSLRNLADLGARNDHDSLGVFQQRPSQGWGTPAQLMDPVYAATKFYQKLLTIAGWEQMAVTVAAQRVQLSAYPDAYAKWEPPARVLVAQVAESLGVTGCVPGAWVNPLPPGTYTLTSPFGPRWGGFHDGQDFAAATGTPIRAAAAGTVISAGCTSPLCDRPGRLDAQGRPVTRGCGLRVIIAHAQGVATTYCHASALIVHTGQTVMAGQVIGSVGSTGNSTGPHLHFEVHLNTRPADAATSGTDPVAFLASVGVQV